MQHDSDLEKLREKNRILVDKMIITLLFICLIGLALSTIVFLLQTCFNFYKTLF